MTSALTQQRAGLLVVGMADLKTSRDPAAVLATYALGSCLGLALWDPEARVGGLLHFMLPESKIDPARALADPATFADTGIPLLFKECYALGAQKHRITVRVAGGACTHGSAESDLFQIGKRNLMALKRLLWTNGVALGAEATGGAISRSLWLGVGNGEIVVRTPDHEHAL